MKKILITGAGGYLGRGLIKPLIGKYSLRLMDVAKFERKEHEVFIGDVGEIETVRKAVQGMDAIVIAHMASSQAGAYKTPEVCFDANVKGTANLFFAAAEKGVKRAILISSISVTHGYQGRAYCEHDLPPKANELYGLTKVCQEVVAEHFYRVHGLKVAVLRVGGIVDADTMINKYGKKVEYPAEIYIDPRDIGEAVRLALELPDLEYESFVLIGSPLAEKKYDIEYSRKRLSWKPKYDFRGPAQSPKI